MNGYLDIYALVSGSSKGYASVAQHPLPGTPVRKRLPPFTRCDALIKSAVVQPAKVPRAATAIKFEAFAASKWLQIDAQNSMLCSILRKIAQIRQDGRDGNYRRFENGRCTRKDRCLV